MTARHSPCYRESEVLSVAVYASPCGSHPPQLEAQAPPKSVTGCLQLRLKALDAAALLPHHQVAGLMLVNEFVNSAAEAVAAPVAAALCAEASSVAVCGHNG